MFDWIIAWFNANGVIGNIAIIVAGALVFYGLVRFLVRLVKPTSVPSIRYPKPLPPSEKPEPPRPEEP